MSLLDMGLFDEPKPVTVPLSHPPSFLDRYAFKQGFPDLAGARPSPSTVDWSQLGSRASYAPPTGASSRVSAGPAFGGDDFSAMTKALTPKKTSGGLDDLLRRSDAIIDKWGDLPLPDYDNDIPPPVPKRRAMTPTEGPDTGAENPNAGSLPGGYFSHLRGPEGTTGNYDAVNSTTGAAGPYQFLPSTWADLMKTAPQLGLTWAGFQNPSKNAGQHDAAIQEFTDRNARMLTARLGRPPTAGELYATHLLGGGGGSALLGNLDAPANTTISGAVFNANPWMKAYRSRPGRELLARLESMMGDTE